MQNTTNHAATPQKDNTMSTPTTITVDNVKYVREDSVAKTLGPVRIVIADRGWVFVGNCEDHADGSVTITNCRNIRKWGTSKGLGELIDGPTSSTVADPYGVVKTLPIAMINVVSGW